MVIEHYTFIFRINSLIKFEEEFSVNGFTFYSEKDKNHAMINRAKIDCITDSSWIKQREFENGLNEILLGLSLEYKITFETSLEKIIRDGRVLQSVSLDKFKMIDLDKEKNRLDILSRLMELDEKVEKVANLLSFAESNRFWINLYSIHELIADDVKRDPELETIKEHLNDKSYELLKRTACNPQAIDYKEARHSVQSQIPPKKPMDRYTAKKLIGGLVDNWIDLKLAKYKMK